MFNDAAIITVDEVVRKSHYITSEKIPKEITASRFISVFI